jgi:hypothetical protein
MNILFSLLLLLQTNSTILENEYVRVLKNDVTCGVASSECTDSVIVALGEITLDGETLQRGDVRVFSPPESYRRPQGEGFLEVLVKAPRPPLRLPAETIYVDNYNVVLHEGERFRVIEGRLRPGEGRPRHSHNQRVIIVLNRTRLHQQPDGGPEFFSDFVPDDVSFGEPLIHAMENVGEEMLRNIVVELKP